MTTPDLLRHLFGPYKTLVFKYGDVVICERVGQVEMVGLSSGRIPWLLGRRGEVVGAVMRNWLKNFTAAGFRTIVLVPAARL